MSSDDLVFATIEGSRILDYLKFVLEYGNGRLLGNISTVIMNLFPTVAILSKAFLLASCCMLLPAILDSHSIWEHLLVMLLFVCLDPALFGETFAWTSGFANYIPPIWMTMVIVRMLQKYPKLTNFRKTAVCAAVAVLGVSSQLYVEHTSGVNLLLALCAAALCIRSRRAELKPCLLWLGSTAIGLGIMLLLPKIFYVPGNYADSYRSLNLDSITSLVISAAKNGIKLAGAYFGPCTLTICAGAGATVWLSRGRRSAKANSVMGTLCAVSTVYLAANLVLATSRYMGKSAVVQHILDTVFLVIPLIVWMIAVWQMEHGKLRNHLLFCLAFAVISIAPLLIVSTVPNRVILQSYMFIIAAAVLCIRAIADSVPASILDRGFACLVLICSLAVSSVFFSIRNMTQLRDEYIRSEIAVGSTQIDIFYIPYDYGSWDHIWIATYYGAEKNNVEFVNIGFDYWMGAHY